MTDKIRPCLWFDGNAEEAARFYVSVLPDSRIVGVTPLVVEFVLAGRDYMGLNGGPGHPFTWAVSLSVDCEDQAEVDRYWAALTADGGVESRCGWLQDRYGLSWQITPRILPRLINDPDRAKADRVMQAMLKMKKIVVADLEAAAAG